MNDTPRLQAFKHTPNLCGVADISLYRGWMLRAEIETRDTLSLSLETRHQGRTNKARGTGHEDINRTMGLPHGFIMRAEVRGDKSTLSMCAFGRRLST